MANSENLKPMNKRTKSEQREIAKKAGIKSGEVRRARKTLKEELLLLLENGDTQNKISFALIKKATKGDIKAFEVIRDTIGEKPADKHELKGEFKQKATLEDIKNLKKMLDE
jgi:hypothetical protein|nr:MAG TPA: hypothetical protein [Caudoviricetes sp.]